MHPQMRPGFKVHGVQRMPAQQLGTAQSYRPVLAPLAYRPQPLPRCLQAKMATLRPPHLVESPSTHRPQPPLSILQAKSSLIHQSQSGQTTRAPLAPPAYRPQPTPRVLQKRESHVESVVAPPQNATNQQPQQQLGQVPRTALQLQREFNAKQTLNRLPTRPVVGLPQRVIQAAWQKMNGLKKDQGYWVSNDDGDAPTGVYKKLGVSRWKNDENKKEYVESVEGKLNTPARPVDPIGGKSQDYHTSYEVALKQAMQFLTKNVVFGGSSIKRKYDETYWKTDKDSDGDEILVLTSKSPAQAIQAIFTYPNLWSLDCIEIIQVGRLYAELQAMGAEEFDKKKKGVFKLSYHQTTGLRGRVFYLRERKRDKFISTDEVTGQKTDSGVSLKTAQEESTFLNALPIGTRVMWSNANDEAYDTDFENENAIKVGDDRFAAHPFGICSAAKIRSKLGPSPDDVPSKAERDAYIRRYVFIKEVEWNARS